MATFGIDELVVSDYALREGALLDAFQRRHGATLGHLHDLRRRSVERLAGMMDPEPEHSAHVAVLALDLFDQTASEHHLDEQARELLEAAALLANVGLYISHSKHHKHAYYVIRNSDRLSGFNDHEIEMVAQVARYHRKSAPSAKHAEFSGLRGRDQQTVRTLAGLLRVAIGLDRTHAGLVRSVRVGRRGKTLTIEALAPAGTDLSLELYTATERRTLLEEVLGRRVRVVQGELADDEPDLGAGSGPTASRRATVVRPRRGQPARRCGWAAPAACALSLTSRHACTSTGAKRSGSTAQTPWSPATPNVVDSAMAAASRCCRCGGTTRSSSVTTTAVGTSTSPIHSRDEKAARAVPASTIVRGSFCSTWATAKRPSSESS